MKTTRTLLTALLFAPLAALQAAEFHVAPTGNDANPGTEAKPFATLERAREAVRALQTREGATVCVRAGTYFLKEPLVFTPEDSGAKDRPVTYVAAPGEKPVISGGMPITGWRQEGKLLVTTVPAVKEGRLYFKNLFVNGHRAIRRGNRTRVSSASAVLWIPTPRSLDARCGMSRSTNKGSDSTGRT